MTADTSAAIERELKAIGYARENKVPFFGICLGMQLAVQLNFNTLAKAAIMGLYKR